MICDHCRRKINENAKFCKYCGKKVVLEKKEIPVKLLGEGKDIFRALEKNVTSSERIRSFGHISSEFIKKVKNIFPDIKGEEEVLAFYDDTIKKNMQNGFCLTTKGMHYKNFMSKPVFLDYKDIKDFKIAVNSLLINEDHEIKITLMSERSKNNIFSFLIDIENIFKENKEDQKYILLVDMKEFGPYNDKLIKDMLNGTLKNKDKIYIRKVDEREFQPVKNLFGDSDKIKEKIKSIDDEQKIKINYCDLNELLKVPGLSLKNAQNILDDRQEGIFIDDVYDLVDKFEIMPHHIGSIESQIDFAHKSEEIKQEITIMTPERKGRIIDF